MKVTKVYVDSKGRSCDGCTRCCEGVLKTQVFGYDIGPGHGGCKFLGPKGCTVYDQRPIDPCRIFQCAWKENSRIPEFMKPDLSNVILMLRYLDTMPFYRMVKCVDNIEDSVYKWAEEFSQQGHNIIAYDKYGKLLIYSENRRFRELARQAHYDSLI